MLEVHPTQQECSLLYIHAELPAPATFMHGTFIGQEQVANTELPIVLIVEDDLAIQAIVDEANTGHR